ncbi:hypothetical protein Tco_1319580 [Tanacetum coccineum]
MAKTVFWDSLLFLPQGKEKSASVWFEEVLVLFFDFGLLYINRIGYPIYVATGNSMRFCTAVRHKDFDIEDKDVEFREVIKWLVLFKTVVVTVSLVHNKALSSTTAADANPLAYELSFASFLFRASNFSFDSVSSVTFCSNIGDIRIFTECLGYFYMPLSPCTAVQAVKAWKIRLYGHNSCWRARFRLGQVRLSSSAVHSFLEVVHWDKRPANLSLRDRVITRASFF